MENIIILENFQKDLVIKNHIRELEGVFQYRCLPIIDFNYSTGKIEVKIDDTARKLANKVIVNMQIYIDSNYKELNLKLKLYAP